jgi:hypothetical protein
MKHQMKTLFAVAGLVAASVFVSQAQPYYVAGDFNGWSSSALQMTAGPNPGEYTAQITGGTPTIPGTQTNYATFKVCTAGFASAWPSGNMLAQYDSSGNVNVHFWPGANTDGWIPAANRVGYDDPNNDLGWSLAGSYNTWGTATTLNPLGNGVYSNSVMDVSAPDTMSFKYQSPPNSWAGINFANPDWANGNGNGSYPTTSPTQVLPVVIDLPNGRFYVGAPALPPTNYVTFQLDMGEQVAFGNFTNTDPNTMLPVNSVAVGGLNGDWGTDQQLTNYTILNPGDLNPGLKTNLYIGKFQTSGYLPVTFNWKFRVNNLDGGYEQPASTAGGNRSTTLTNQNTIMPKIFYDDLGIGDLVASATTVKFTLYMPDQTPVMGGLFFTKGIDTPYVNGPWRNWDWGTSQGLQLVEVGTSDLYTNSWLFPRGSSIYVTYKYSADGPDNENGSNTNHIREIRSYGPTYSFPQDMWSWTACPPGTPYPNPGIASTNIVEPDFGYLSVSAPSAGTLPIKWLGRPGVQLENRSSLSSGIWNPNTATDGTQATNWPNAGNSQFFRLIKP